MTRSLCKRDTKSNSHPNVKLTPVRADTSFVTRDTEKCPLPVLPTVCIKRVNFIGNM